MVIPAIARGDIVGDGGAGAGDRIATHSVPRATLPPEHRGAPTHAELSTLHVNPGQQHCAASSIVLTLPFSHGATHLPWTRSCPLGHAWMPGSGTSGTSTSTAPP